MAAPVTPQSSESTFEDMEAQLKAAEAAAVKPDLSKITVDSDDAPDTVKGKSVAETIAQVKRLEEALRMSEQGRQQALIMAQTASQRPVQVAPEARQPEPEPQITAEMVAEAFAEDQGKGILLMQKMNEQTVARYAQQFQTRIEPLLSGTMSAVEAEARRKYPDEFSIYEDEIKTTLGQVKNKSVMSDLSSWDDLVAYVRGKDPMKLFKHYQEKERATQQQAAHEEQRQVAGISMSGGRTPTPQGSRVVMDEYTREICKVLQISEEDYLTWSKVGG